MRHLVIMAKQPVAGRVKSRLARSIGVARATGVYRNLMTTTMRTLATDRRWKTWVAVAPDTAVCDFYWPYGVMLFPQGHGNLGQRMQRIFDTVPTGVVIIIGTDIPFISTTDIADAFTQLGSNDLVFGGAGDGGFWLIGARRTPRIPRVFDNVRWSSEHTLADTLANAHTAGLKTGYAATRYDIDIKADYQKWRKAQRHDHKFS